MRTPVHAPTEYARNPCAFIDAFLPVNELGQPFRLLPHQRALLKAAFTFDATGHLAWDTFIYSCPKKSGKTTINAALTLWWAMWQEAPNELLVLANDLEQATGRVFNTLLKLLRKNPALLAVAPVVDKMRIALANETEIRALASEAPGSAGSNHGWTSWEEIWGYTSENSHRLFEELVPVDTRENSLRLITTYAGYENESDLLHGLYLQGVGPEEHPEGQGTRVHPDLLLYLNVAARLLVYWDHAPRMPWQLTPKARTKLAAEQHTMRPTAYLRLHENRWTTSESTFITAPLWDGCVDPAHVPQPPSRRLPIVVGIDAATKRDCTAIVALTQAADARWALVKHRILTPTPTAPINLQVVEDFVLALHAQYHVLLVLADPFQMQSSIGRLEAAGVPIIEYTQTPANLTHMATAVSDALKDKMLQLYPDAELRQHALNTVCVESRQGLRIAREKTSRKIDGIIALAMALVAAKDCFADSVATRLAEAAMDPDTVRDDLRQVRQLLPGFGGMSLEQHPHFVPDDTGQDYEGRDMRWRRNGEPMW
jgi:phage terminase large subunit-like protein